MWPQPVQQQLMQGSDHKPGVQKAWFFGFLVFWFFKKPKKPKESQFWFFGFLNKYYIF